jgi:hypothetical protein
VSDHTHVRFFYVAASLFEMADLWVDTTRVGDYVTYLTKLYSDMFDAATRWHKLKLMVKVGSVQPAAPQGQGLDPARRTGTEGGGAVAGAGVSAGAGGASFEPEPRHGEATPDLANDLSPAAAQTSRLAEAIGAAGSRASSRRRTPPCKTARQQWLQGFVVCEQERGSPSATRPPVSVRAPSGFGSQPAGHASPGRDFKREPSLASRSLSVLDMMLPMAPEPPRPHRPANGGGPGNGGAGRNYGNGQGGVVGREEGVRSRGQVAGMGKVVGKAVGAGLKFSVGWAGGSGLGGQGKHSRQSKRSELPVLEGAACGQASGRVGELAEQHGSTAAVLQHGFVPGGTQGEAVRAWELKVVVAAVGTNPVGSFGGTSSSGPNHHPGEGTNGGATACSKGPGAVAMASALQQLDVSPLSVLGGRRATKRSSRPSRGGLRSSARSGLHQSRCAVAVAIGERADEQIVLARYSTSSGQNDSHSDAGDGGGGSGVYEYRVALPAQTSAGCSAQALGLRVEAAEGTRREEDEGGATNRNCC